MQTYIAVVNSPIGKLGITTSDIELLKINFLPEASELLKPQHAFVQFVTEELAAYFENSKHPFNIPLHIEGSDYQRKVWAALQNIKSGETLTYGSLAKKLQSGPRAIGFACRTNRIPIIIPCHRIVAANHLGGFSGQRAGSFTVMKQWLLAHEHATYVR